MSQANDDVRGGRHITANAGPSDVTSTMPDASDGPAAGGMPPPGDLPTVDEMPPPSGDPPPVEATAGGPVPEGGGGAVPSVRGYDVAGVLGRGGMGVVWRAVQHGTRRPVALKVMGPQWFASARARRRFEREVELAARLEHPGVAHVYEGGSDRGIWFYAMELVDGVPLHHYVRDHRLSRRQVLALVRQVCEAVQHAHQRGVIHRDLKPFNILVTADGQPEVLDFGLAKGLVPEEEDRGEAGAAAGPDVTWAGEVAGTPAYMSPEQAAGEPVDTRTDVYSLGVILYWLLTGKSPHDLSGGGADLVRRKTTQDVTRPRAADPKMDKELEALLLKALAKDPDDRYASAGDLAKDIGNYLAGDPLAAKGQTTTYFLRKRVAKYRWSVGSAAALLALTVGAAVYARRQFDRQRQESFLRLQKEQQQTLAQKVEAERRDRLDELTQLVARRPAGAQMFASRAAAHFWLGEYREATADYVQSLDLDPTDHRRWYHLACLRWYLGDEAGYRATAAEMLARFKDSTDPLVAERTAKACLLSPRPVGEPALLGSLTDRALAPGAPSWKVPWFELAKGMVEYRGGRYEAALPLLARARDKIPQTEGKATAEAFLALCHHHQGRNDQAQAVLAQALRRVVVGGPWSGEDTATIENWLIYQIAVREAVNTVPNVGGKPWPDLPVTRPVAWPTTLPAAEPYRRPAGPMVDLLPRIDPASGAVQGGWRREGTTLVSSGNAPVGQSDLLEIPYRPPAEYDLLAEFTKEGDGSGNMSLSLTYGGTAFRWAMRVSSGNCGFEMIDGRRFNEGPTFAAVLLGPGPRHQVVVQVRSWGLRAYVDGQLASEWRTDYHDLTQTPDRQLRDANHLGLGSTERATRFHKVEVIDITAASPETRPASTTRPTKLPGLPADRPPPQFPTGPATRPAGAPTRPANGPATRPAGPAASAREALAAASRALDADPDNPKALAGRADARARAGEYATAAEDFERAVALDPSNQHCWYQLTCLRLHLGQEQECQKTCREILRRFGDAPDVVTRRKAAKACLLLPPTTADDLSAARRLAERVAEADPGVWSWQVLGLAHYRSGRFADAAKALAKADDLARTSAPKAAATATTWAALAMAQHRIGATQVAEQSLRRAREAVEAAWAAGDLGGQWNDWLIARALVREAEAVLAGQPAATRPATAPAAPAPPTTRPAAATRMATAPGRPAAPVSRPAGGPTSRPAAAGP